MQDSKTELRLLLAQLKNESVYVVEKKGMFWWVLNVLVVIVTFGGNRNFLERYYTTIGPVIGVPTGWEESSAAHRYSVLLHERHHVGQFRKGGLGSAWLGILPVGIAYLLLPLPMGFAWCRWRFEREAYAVGIRAKLSFGFSEERRRELLDHATEALVGPAYGWTAKLWPGRTRCRAWFESAVPPMAQPDGVLLKLT